LNANQFLVYLALIILWGTVFNVSALDAGQSGIVMPAAYQAKQLISGNNTRRVILEKAEAVLKKHFNPETHRFRLSARWIPQKVLRLEPEKIKAVELQGRVERYTNFQVICQARGAQHKVQVQLAVKMEQKVPVTNRRISSGEVITKEDFSSRWTSVSNIN